MSAICQQFSEGYSGACILRPPVQPEEYHLILKVFLKWRDIFYIENIMVVLLDG